MSENTVCKTIIPPFRIKVVEHVKSSTIQERTTALKAVNYSYFEVNSDLICIDMMTDSGTAALSNSQWSDMMMGDEAYSGGRSWNRFKTTSQDIFGFEHVFPAHQGRAAENVLFGTMFAKEKEDFSVAGNGNYDTTKTNLMLGSAGLAKPVNIARSPKNAEPDFGGNMDVDELTKFLESNFDCKLVILTITDNNNGGLPVSIKNMRETYEICRKFKVPLYFDACRFAENVAFIKRSETEFQKSSIRKIVKTMFKYCDGGYISAKKDGISNMGAVFFTRQTHLVDDIKARLVAVDGFYHYGGLCGRDLEAMTTGFLEAMDEKYLDYRLWEVEYLAEGLKKHGIPIVEPVGGHAVYINISRLFPDRLKFKLPGATFVIELFKRAGIRAMEFGSIMGAKLDPVTFEVLELPQRELVRLAIPRRVYTKSHLDYVIEACADVASLSGTLKGYKIVSVPENCRWANFRLEVFE